MTVLKFGGKFGKGAYQTSGGLHGVGVTVVNFLSEWCEVEVRRGGHVYQQEYERGVPSGDVRRIGTTDKVGTKTIFKADPHIFPNTKFVYNTLYRRLQELAFLNRGIKIIFRDERTGDGDTFQYERGILEFVEYLNRASEPPTPTSSTSPANTMASASKSPCSIRANTPRTSIRTSTTSTRPKVARTFPASARR